MLKLPRASRQGCLFCCREAIEDKRVRVGTGDRLEKEYGHFAWLFDSDPNSLPRASRQGCLFCCREATFESYRAMIRVTRLNGKRFVVNAEQIRYLESTPDTVITLINGDQVHG